MTGRRRQLSRGWDSGTPMSHIHLAAQEGDMLRVQELLSDEPDLVNAMDRCGHVPLIYAARSNEAQVTR